MNTQPRLITVPLDELAPCPANVRRTGRKDGIPALAASIAAHGLRQNLNVRQAPSGRYEVVAGGRRLAALRLLAKQGTLAKAEPVPCLLLAKGDNPAEISLAENAQRRDMHPDDQCTAFRALIEEQGLPLPDVAARFGVSPAVVRQRLKLAHVSPKLRARFRKGELTLAHMEALAIRDDHAAQEQAWANLPDWNRDPDTLKSALTRDCIPLTDKLARFVGVAAYEEAGGVIVRDLFDAEDEGYMGDPALVEWLADALMAQVVKAVQEEGWKWVRAEWTRDYSTAYTRVYPQGEDDAYAPADMARAGARLLLEHDGTVRVERGLVHPDDARAEATRDAAPRAPGKAAYPAPLVEELTAHRTAALRLELTLRPTVALAATVHALAHGLLYRMPGSCLALHASRRGLAGSIRAPQECGAHGALEQMAEFWGARLPDDEADLFAWCLAQPQDVLLDLLAYLAALSVDAVQAKGDSAHGFRLTHADQLAQALALDMGEHWTPTAEGFGARLTRAQLVDTARDAGVLGECGNLAAAKKDEAARRVTTALARAGWLPALLRAPQPIAPEADAQAA